MSPVLLLMVVVLGVFFLLTFLARGGRRLNLERQARVQAARPMKARVVALSKVQDPPGGSHTPLLRLNLELLPEGGAPYPAQTTWWVKKLWLPNVQPGQEVAVRVDTEDRARIYPDFEEAWMAWEVMAP
jgi:hypothetical protein